MVRNEMLNFIGQQIEIVGQVSVRYDDSGRVVIGNFNIIVDGQVVKGDDHIGINPNNFEGYNQGDFPFVERGDNVHVIGQVVEYQVSGNRNSANRGKVNVRFDNIVEFIIE